MDQTESSLLHAAGHGAQGEGRFCSLFSYPSWTCSLSLPSNLPSPISPPCLGRPHRAPGRVVHEEDFPLNHILSLFARACVCMLKGGGGVGGGGPQGTLGKGRQPDSRSSHHTAKCKCADITIYQLCPTTLAF